MSFRASRAWPSLMLHSIMLIDVRSAVATKTQWDRTHALFTAEALLALIARVPHELLNTALGPPHVHWNEVAGSYDLHFPDSGADAHAKLDILDPAAGPMSGTYRRTRLEQFFGWSHGSWRSRPRGDA